MGLVGLPGEMTQILIQEIWASNHHVLLKPGCCISLLLSKLGKCVPRDILADDQGAEPIFPDPIVAANLFFQRIRVKYFYENVTPFFFFFFKLLIFCHKEFGGQKAATIKVYGILVLSLGGSVLHLGTRFSKSRESGTVVIGTTNFPKRVTESDVNWGYSSFHPWFPRPPYHTHLPIILIE